MKLSSHMRSVMAPVRVGIVLRKADPPADHQLKASLALLEKANALQGQLTRQAEVQEAYTLALEKARKSPDSRCT